MKRKPPQKLIIISSSAEMGIADSGVSKKGFSGSGNGKNMKAGLNIMPQPMLTITSDDKSLKSPCGMAMSCIP
eukprot:CAMPEP_0119316842 /NCGR_PEP_ID=MMETSP1333-20130426/41087_1 /TAXON_ID=418940 /ORGANISM="Scyphosphaera apsteinii, Strain RCC1455" /LENGTH=72 /DNA_ID=CAMNT_0007322603 /DNA_START=172 /DNA_END=387 /DNA_ORIENTATION=-